MADPIVDAILSNQQNRDFWQGTLRNLVQTIAQIPQMREQAAERRALAEDRMAQTQLRQGQLQVLQQQQAMKQRQQQTMDNVNRYMSQVMDDDGNVKMDVFGPMMQGVPVDQQANIVGHLKTVQEFAQKAKDAKNAYLVKALDAAIAQKTPEAYEFAIAHAVKNKMIAPDDAQSLYAQLASGQDPTALAKQMRDTLAGPKAPVKLDIIPAGATAYNPETKQAEFTAPAKETDESAQSKSVLLDGKPAEVMFLPKTRKFVNAAGEDVTARVKPMPPASVMYPTPGGTADKDVVDYWVKQVTNDPTQWNMLSNNKPLQQAVQAGLAKQGSDLNKLTAQGRAMKETAQEILPHIDTIEREARDLDAKGLMGPLGGRWRDLVAGKIGAGALVGSQNAPAVGKFLTDVGLMMTAVARAHGGARGGGSPAMLEHMKSLMDAHGKDLDLFLGNLASTREWMQGYAEMGSGAGAKPQGSAGEGVKIGAFTVREKK